MDEVADDGDAVIHQKNKFSLGDEIEVVHPDFTSDLTKVERIIDDNGEEVGSAPHPKQRLKLKLGVSAGRYDVLRMKND